MLIAVAGVLLGSLGFSDAQCISRLKEFQRQLGIHDYRVEFVAGGNVATAFEKVVLCIHHLGSSLGVLANEIFEHDHVAGLAYRIIRLRGNDQSESLEVGSNVKLAAVAIQQYFTEKQQQQNQQQKAQ